MDKLISNVEALLMFINQDILGSSLRDMEFSS